MVHSVLSLATVLLLVVLHSCGKPMIATGRNGQPPANAPEMPKSEGESPSSMTPTTPVATVTAPTGEAPTSANAGSTTANPEGPTSGSTRPAVSGRVTCFGKSADVAPAELTEFCRGIPADLQRNYSKAHQILCVEKKLHNLFLPQCGWNGSGELTSFNRVLESTPLNDSGEEFYYLSAASLTLGPSPHTYPNVAMLAYADPAEFRKRFIVAAGAEITPDGNGIQETSSDRRVHYRFSVMGLTKTSFYGEIRTVAYGKNLRAVFNTALKEFDGIKARQNLTLVLSLPDGREKLLSIEERLVPDGGQHQIAWSKMLKLDQAELENRFKNSKVP